MAPRKSRNNAQHRRCKRCGRFIASSSTICASCQAVGTIAEGLEAADAGESGSRGTEFGRTLADLGLDVRFLSQNSGGADVSRRFRADTVATGDRMRTVGPAPMMQPPLRSFRDSLFINARRDSVIARSGGIQSRPAPLDAAAPKLASKSVLTSIGPVAAARRASSRSRPANARPTWGDARASARQIAITFALIFLSAVLGAGIPLLLSLLGR